MLIKDDKEIIHLFRLNNKINVIFNLLMKHFLNKTKNKFEIDD
jgi:hypothetical protein